MIARDASKASDAGKTSKSVTEPTFELFVQDWYINCTKTIIQVFKSSKSMNMCDWR